MGVLLKKKDSGRSRERSLEEELQFQKKFNYITNKIHSAKDTNDILLNLQKDILGLFDADRITVYVVDGIRKQIVSRFKTGNEINEIRVPIDKGSIAGYCAATASLVNIKNAYDEKELKSINPHLRFDKSWDKKTGYKTTQVLAAPITYNRYLLGVVQLINKKNGEVFGKGDENAALEIAKVLGIAIFNNHRSAHKAKPTRFDYLITNNIISNKDLSEAMARARKTKRSVEAVLMADFQVSKEDIGKSLASFYKTRFISYDERMPIPGELLKGLRVSYLKSNVFVPIGHSGNKVVIAMEDPGYLPARDAVKRIIPAKEFEYCVALKEDIFKMIELFFDIKRTEFLEGAGSIEEILGKLDPGEEEYDEEVEGVSEQDSAIVQLVNKMIVDAYHRGASDIHIEPRQGKQNALIRFRVDGACQIYQTIPYSFKRAIVSRIKIMADLDISERRLPQDGKIKFRRFAPLDIELRVATIPTTGQNEDVVLRLLTTGEPIPLDKMGMSERDYNALLDIITKPYGMIL
ncbi:MAG: pilus assembly protein, partial [Deltaproteobacteria bacterium]